MEETARQAVADDRHPQVRHVRPTVLRRPQLPDRGAEHERGARADPLEHPADLATQVPAADHDDAGYDEEHADRHSERDGEVSVPTRRQMMEQGAGSTVAGPGRMGEDPHFRECHRGACLARMKPFPLACAVLLAGTAVSKRRQMTKPVQAAAALGVAGLLLVGVGLVQLPNLEELIRHAGSALGDWTYLLVGALAFLETGAGVGLIAPGELAVILGGVTAGQGITNAPLMVGIVWVAALSGDITSFYVGRRLGRDFLVRHGSAFGIKPARIEQVERFFARHGGKTIVLGRFIGLVRALAPFLAGASEMPARRFVPSSALASGIWSASLVALGYVFWSSLDDALALARRGSFAVAGLIALAVLLYAAHHRRRAKEYG
jgi:membrane protein DedA with SNARE-associated domain